MQLAHMFRLVRGVLFSRGSTDELLYRQPDGCHPRDESSLRIDPECWVQLITTLCIPSFMMDEGCWRSII